MGAWFAKLQNESSCWYQFIIHWNWYSLIHLKQLPKLLRINNYCYFKHPHLFVFGWNKWWIGAYEVCAK